MGQSSVGDFTGHICVAQEMNRAALAERQDDRPFVATRRLLTTSKTKAPEDFVIATGQTRKLQDFVAAAFDAVGLDWREHTMIDQTLFRPTEIMVGQGDASKAAEKLGWKPKYKMDEVVRMMVQAAIEAGE